MTETQTVFTVSVCRSVQKQKANCRVVCKQKLMLLKLRSVLIGANKQAQYYLLSSPWRIRGIHHCYFQAINQTHCRKQKSGCGCCEDKTINLPDSYLAYRSHQAVAKSTCFQGQTANRPTNQVGQT